MAVVAVSRVDERDAIMLTWGPLANGDTGTPVDLPAHAGRTFQVTGTFGAGGSVNLEGSNVGSTFFILTDPQGNAITKTAAGGEEVIEAPKFVRPNVTAGDGTTALTVTLYCRRGIR
jgi:hypothetical protein